jgi:hypothetical protein
MPTMKVKDAIKLAGAEAGKEPGTETYADLAAVLGLTRQGVHRWGPNIPDLYVYKLKVLRPQWFEKSTGKPKRAALLRKK